MRPNKLSLLLIAPMILIGCRENAKPKAHNTPEKGVVQVNMAAMLDESRGDYELKFNYDNSFFNEYAYDFSNDLMRLSFASSVVSGDKEASKSFFETMFFENVQTYGYDDEPTSDSIAYTFATKDIGQFVIVGISIRGFNYKAEWANNLTIGSSENKYHIGFEARANDIRTSLSTYLDSIETSKQVRLWISGYSRAGAVSLVLNDMLIQDEDSGFHQQDLYVYTFEAPNCIRREETYLYNNAFNMCNKYDLVQSIPPKEEYDMSKCGTYMEIYNENLPEFLKKLDKKVTLPTFTPKAGQYTNPGEFISWLINGLTYVNETYPDDSLATRDDYVNHYQEGFSYLIGLYFSLPQETIDHVMDKFNECIEQEDYSSLLACLFAPDALYDFIHPVLDEDQISYDSTSLNKALNLVPTFIRSHSDLVGAFIDIFGQEKIRKDMVDNVSYIVKMHYPEVTYSLIMNQDFNDPSDI